MKSLDMDEEKGRGRTKSRDKGTGKDHARSREKTIDKTPCFEKGSFFFGTGGDSKIENKPGS
jgi:hypothetical protein